VDVIGKQKPEPWNKNRVIWCYFYYCYPGKTLRHIEITLKPFL